MRLDQKKKMVDELADKMERANIVIATSYRGLTVAQMTELRRKLRQGNIEYRVVKNNLVRFAAERTGKEGHVGSPGAYAPKLDKCIERSAKRIAHLTDIEDHLLMNLMAIIGSGAGLIAG